MSAIDEKALRRALSDVAYVPGDHPVVPVKYDRFVKAVQSVLDAAIAPQQAAPMPGLSGFELRSVIYDALDLSEELRVECTDAVVAALSALATPEAGTSEREPVDWLWWGQDEAGLDHVSFGRWQKHPCQHRYTYAKPQATEHDHPAPAQAPVDGEAVRALTDEQIDAAIREWMSDDDRTSDGFSRRMRAAIAAALAAAPSARKEP